MTDISSKLDKRFQSLTPEQLLGCSIEALKGVSATDALALERALGIRTIGDLAENEFVLVAQAILQAARAPVVPPLPTSPGAPPRTAASVLAAHGVPNIGLTIAPHVLANPAVVDALDAALTCLIHSKEYRESPLWMVMETPDDFGLTFPADEADARAVVVQRLNGATGLTLIMDPEDPTDEWAGKVELGDTSERFGTTGHWIFKLADSPFTDLNFAVVDKVSGQAKCWGFS